MIYQHWFVMYDKCLLSTRDSVYLDGCVYIYIYNPYIIYKFYILILYIAIYRYMYIIYIYTLYKKYRYISMQIAIYRWYILYRSYISICYRPECYVTCQVIYNNKSVLIHYQLWNHCLALPSTDHCTVSSLKIALVLRVAELPVPWFVITDFFLCKVSDFRINNYLTCSLFDCP